MRPHYSSGDKIVCIIKVHVTISRRFKCCSKSICQYRERPYSYGIVLKENSRLIGLVELYERGLDEYNGL